MATEDFKVLQKVQDLMEYSYPILCQFPKAERFSFAQDIRHCMNTLLELTITEDKRYIKKSTIENMDIENEKLKIYIRVAFKLQYIITAWPFKNRVVNCAAYNVLWPIYSRGMYEHSYGSIPGRGQVKATQQLQKWMKKSKWTGNNQWVAKADVAKFFFRVPHDVQLRELGKPLDDPDMMWFLETCIKGDGRATGLPLDCGDPSEAERIFGIGMPVGSLISQMTANVVMTPLDHFMKRIVRVPYYIRYMDDMIMLGESKQQMWDCLGMMDDFLQSQLGLQLNNKTAVMKYDDGVEFVGRVVRPDRIDLRKSSSLQMKRHLNYVKEAYANGEVPLEYALDVITSYIGLLKHTDSKALMEKVCEDYVLIRHSAPEE